MIRIGRHDYGTAAEILAEHAWPDVTVDMIYRWAERGLIQRFHSPGRGRGSTWYRDDQVAAAERQTAEERRGAPRSLDTAAALP